MNRRLLFVDVECRARMMPFFKAHASAASSTTGPRRVLIKCAERFIRASAAWLIMCRVSGVSGQ